MILLYILLAVVIFGFLIFIHELGHFLAARACHVTINEFAIGMGPKLISFCPGKRRAEKDALNSSDPSEGKETAVDSAMSASESVGIPTVHTAYSLRAIPIGGFVSMAGEDEESDDPNAYDKKTVWQRILISVAGPLMNILLGVLLMFIVVSNSVYLTTRIVYDHTGENENTVYQSEAAGLKSEDVVLEVNGVKVKTGDELVYEIMYQGTEPLDILIERDGKQMLIEDVVFPTVVDQGVTFGMRDFKIYTRPLREVSFGARVKATLSRSFSTVKMVFDSLTGMFNGRLGVESVSGPVGVTELITTAAKTNWLSLVYVITVISINLGVMNLLPIPALDGGHLLTYLVEIIIRRPIPKRVEIVINFTGLALLMLLMLLISAKDVVSLITRYFLKS